jgi:hypothetical protein
MAENCIVMMGFCDEVGGSVCSGLSVELSCWMEMEFFLDGVGGSLYSGDLVLVPAERESLQ